MPVFNDLSKRTSIYGEEILAAVERVVTRGWYLLGEELSSFEHEYASYIGTSHCIGVGNGLDALTLIYQGYMELGMLSPGDEVLVPANTYIASILSITANGLVPVPVEPCPDTLLPDLSQMERLLTPRTKSLMLVHLYGRCTYTDAIGAFCASHGLLLVEDNAQSHGCRFGKRLTGSLGHASGHSFYPTKNLGALGDAGAVTTSDATLASVIRALRNYGSSRKYVFDYVGRNSRMDEVQAAVLRVRLRHLDADNLHRGAIAACYESLRHVAGLHLLSATASGGNVWHIFPIFCEQRDLLQHRLASRGVETQTHYPIPPHRQRCLSQWHHLSLPVTERIHATELSLPIGPELTLSEAESVAHIVEEEASRLATPIHIDEGR